jgi:hypothetical protein
MADALWRCISEGWNFLVYAFSAFALIGLIVGVLGAMLAGTMKWLRDRRDGSYREGTRARRVIKREALRAKPRGARVLLWFMRIWVGLVLIINLGAVCGSFIAFGLVGGFMRVQEIYSPFTVSTYVINGMLLLPAY